ncbi:MAG: proton-conducting transporter membrane subunit, partial [Chloroflexota bacterium]
VLLVNLVALAASLYIRHYLSHQAEVFPQQSTDATRFHVIFNLFHFTMLLVPMVDNLVLLWICVELTTITSTILVGHRRDRLALEAAWKYIVITSTGIIFALLGTLFLANANPAGESMNWSQLAKVASRFDPNFVKLSFLFILVGYGAKAGFAPMHTWLPDGHGEAPFPVSALLSGVLLKSALYAILRFYTLTNLALGDTLFTSRILLVSGLFSLALATPFILKRNRFKRVLAYHSLEHMGIITFGLGIGGNIALFGALLHALNHAITKALMFLAFGNVQVSYARVRGDEEEHVVGILRAMPITGLVLALGGLALVGAPPFNIFLSEFIILWAAVQQAVEQSSFGLAAATALFVLSVTLIFAGLVRHLGRMLIGIPPSDVKPETVGHVLPLLVLFAIVLVFGFTVPSIGLWDIPRLLRQSVLVIECGVLPCR